MKIYDGYCNGYFGRRYDLTDSLLEAKGIDWEWIVIKTTSGEYLFASLNHLKYESRIELVNSWSTEEWYGE